MEKNFECAAVKEADFPFCLADVSTTGQIALDNGKLAACDLCFKEVYQEARNEAATDYDTKLVNRRGLEGIIEEYSRLGIRFGLIHTDYTGFKAVNDKLNHATGDMVIKEGAKTLQGRRKKDVTGYLSSIQNEENIAARIGGDEFAVLVVLEQASLDDEAPEEKRAEINEDDLINRLIKVGQMMAENFCGSEMIKETNAELRKKRAPLQKRKPGVGIRFGVAVYQPNDSLDDLLKKSDPKHNMAFTTEKQKNFAKNLMRFISQQ